MALWMMRKVLSLQYIALGEGPYGASCCFVYYGDLSHIV